MVSDDLTALSGIAIGALASTALTLSLAARELAPVVVEPQAAPAPMADAVPCVRPADRRVIDFAIIRSHGERDRIEFMVGPEGPRTGWVTPQRATGPLVRPGR
jgi:hypothetical protein